MCMEIGRDRDETSVCRRFCIRRQEHARTAREAVVAGPEHGGGIRRKPRAEGFALRIHQDLPPAETIDPVSELYAFN